MDSPPAADVTLLLYAWRAGDAGALERLLPVVYSELRRIAHARMRAEGPSDQTLQTTALVHEAYVRLVEGANVPWQDRVHFYAVSARLMRRILVDHARERHTRKRGGSDRTIPFGDWLGAVPARDEDLLALDEALRRLATIDSRMGQVVEMRYFAGLNVDETADALGVCAKTVKRDWRVARAWLHKELKSRDTEKVSRDLGPGRRQQAGRSL